MERATALVIHGTDFSETSRIVTLWTKELGKVRALAKGGRRLKSNFDVALDLLTVCGIVLLRKSSGSLDLLTEARVEERFPALRQDLSALYAAYYVAELLGDWTQDYDPHPILFDEALATLRNLGQPGVITGPCLAHFELVLLRELGYGPALDYCADCDEELPGQGLAFSAAGGGVVCPKCQPKQREKRVLNEATWQALLKLQKPGDAWREVHDSQLRGEVRQLLNHYVTYQLGRRPRLLPYLGS
ncbi:MAG: DNA repair protein RecO [Gemmataceae bacterium]|nr:DNA repair protein RecO [Gemmataceae bacterium]